MLASTSSSRHSESELLLSTVSIDGRALYYEAKNRGCAVRVCVRARQLTLAKTWERVCRWRRSRNQPKSFVQWYKINIILISYLRLTFPIILVSQQLTVQAHSGQLQSDDSIARTQTKQTVGKPIIQSVAVFSRPQTFSWPTIGSLHVREPTPFRVAHVGEWREVGHLRIYKKNERY